MLQYSLQGQSQIHSVCPVDDMPMGVPFSGYAVKYVNDIKKINNREILGASATGRDYTIYSFSSLFFCYSAQ